MVGRVVGNFRILEKIGEGGMGAVYRANDEMLDREVAIKAIRPELAREPQIVERFRAEARILARVNHPAIATIYTFFHEGGELFLAMEYVDGRTLAEVIADHGAMPWPQAVRLLSTALEGIAQAHRAGIIHRDLKPDNLMLTEAGTLKVMDFGIARMAGSSHLTQTGLLVGTLRYVAPEQIRGEEVDQRTDIYALGAVLFQMLTGRVPFEGPTDFAILKAQLEDAPVPPSSLVPGLPGWLDQAVLKALEKDPAARFQTVDEMRSFLGRQDAGATAVQAELAAETLVLPPRSPTSDSTRASAATVETDRTRLPPGPPPLPAAVAPPPVPSSSYRPVQGVGWKRAAITALVLAAVTAAGLFLWSRRGTEGAPAAAGPPVSPAGGPATAVAIEPEPAPESNAGGSSSASPTAATQPPRPAPAREAQKVPGPANPPTSSAHSPGPAKATAEEEPRQAPAEPAASQETPAAEPEPTAGELPVEELSRLGSELVAASQKLGESYAAFLEQKEDGGAELTASDEKLQEELEALSDAADRFNNRFNEGVFARTRDRLRKTDQRTELVRRFRLLAAAAGRVERLMAEVQPGAEVRQDWQEVRHRWERAGRLLRER